MSDQGNDFLKDYQAFAQQSWDAWMRQLQQMPGMPPFGAPAATPPVADDLLARSLAGLQAYSSWLQQAAGLAGMPAMAGVPGMSGMPGMAGMPGMSAWPQAAASMPPFMDAFVQPFTQAVAGLDGAQAFGFDRQWQHWLQAMQRGGVPGMPPSFAQFAPLGITRELQLDQQALTSAINDYIKLHARYQLLLQQVQAQGVARLQETIAKLTAEPGHQVESMKALYDMWVDAMESAYAEMALSEEYRETFGAMVNAQMQVRKLQQQNTEQWCRELGIPTRSEVDSLGQRVQQLRREMQASRQHASSADGAAEVDALQAEIVALKRELARSKVSKVQPIHRKNTEAEQGKGAAASRSKTARPAAGKRK